MNRNDKNATLSAYKELFDGVEAVVLTDVSGVPVNTINELRSKFRAEGVTYKVVKNTIFKLAIQGTELEVLSDTISGPVAVALKKGDPVSPAKIAIEFLKTSPKFKIKGGYVSGSVLDLAGVESLAKMKDKNELRAELLSVFKAPQTQFVGVCNTMVTQILGLLSARADKLEEAA
ncbi:MAG: 50S ribosomal protein L10 [Bradymonadales bacterium]|jgi:large subunit ribosomal protein L10